MRQRMLTALLIAPVISGMGAATALGQVGASVTANANNSFTPAAVTIVAGQSVSFANVGGGDHNVHFADQASGLTTPSTGDWTASRTFAAAGSYSFVCDIHAFMTGTVTVNPAPVNVPAPVTPAPAPVPGAPAPGAPTSPALDTVAPRATRVSGSATLRRATVRLRLSERATVVARLTRRGSTHTLTRATHTLAAGSRTVTLRRSLTAGSRYTVSLRITDAAGNVTRRTVALTAHG